MGELHISFIAVARMSLMGCACSSSGTSYRIRGARCTSRQAVLELFPAVVDAPSARHYSTMSATRLSSQRDSTVDAPTEPPALLTQSTCDCQR